jgi:hypothetical protein
MLENEVICFSIIIYNKIVENEEKWLNYEEEQTEVGCELADIIFEMMLEEASDEL